MKSISIMLLGTDPFELLSRLANLDDDRKHFIHCFNVLDYTVPTMEDQITARHYRTELRRAFRLLKRIDTGLPETQLAQLRKHDFLELDDIDLEVNAWIQQVFDNKENYDSVYKFLSGDLTKSNIELVPLVDNSPEIMVHRGKRLAPLRYYYQQKELLDRLDQPYFEPYDDLESDDLAITGHEVLSTLKLNEESYSALDNSEFVVILPSDLVSLGVFSKMQVVLDQIRKLSTNVILIIPEMLTEFANFAEKDIFKLLSLGGETSKMVDHLSYTMEYVLSPDKDNWVRQTLLESGYQIEDDNMADPLPAQNTDFTDFLRSLYNK